MTRSGIVDTARLNRLAEIVDELARKNYGEPLTALVVGDAVRGFRVATVLGQVELAESLRTLVARIERDLAEGAS